jgi:LuxR family transcriptional regulator, maltose regulon positive regulatory protein
MPLPILATKLYIPPARYNLVLRTRLVERLNEGSGRKLILISAPAGFGKTTLVSAWIAGWKQPVAWLSLDEGDGDPTRFLTYFINALQTVSPDTGSTVLNLLASQQPPPIETLLTSLMNELSALSQEIFFILDDYHALDSKPVDAALAFLLQHMPERMHLVITTREDPDLPLAKIRAQGQLTELRAADLRFTPTEATEFLNSVMDLDLSDVEVAALEARTEGWIAGLQMAAISMQDRGDIPGFIRAFTGSHRFVLDYLVEEVLRHQPEAIRRFLLQTSILGQLCAPLCDAVTGQSDGREMLEALERSNLFLIPLDDQRQWYRYHHLFAEVLQSHLREVQPDPGQVLHRRASAWFEQNDSIAEAIRHSLAARDHDRAANLIEKIWIVMDRNYQYDTWLGWVRSLPEELVRAHPVLCVGYAWGLLGTGELEASEARLRDAERWLEPADQKAGEPLNNQPPGSDQGMIVVDETEFRSLAASIAAARAYRSLALGDIPGVKMYAREAQASAQDDQSQHYTQAIALLGIAEYASGNLHVAEEGLLKFQALMWRVNDIASAIGITFTLANIKLVQGRLREAVSAYQQSLQQAVDRGAPFFIGASELHRGLSELLCEQNDLDSAARYLQSAQQAGEQGATTGWPQRFYIAQARLKESQGDLAGALVLLEEAERELIRNPLPDRPVAALIARTWVRMGELSKALFWVREQKLSPDDDLSFMHEFEHLTLARALIARYITDRKDDDLHAALGLLQRLLQAAEDGGRNGSAIEILILQSLAHQAGGDQALALATLERALALAAPEGYVRVFVDEGELMKTLLGELAKEQGHPLQGYLKRLLEAFTRPVAAISVGTGRLKPGLAEPLSERELEVLKLLRSELSGPEIARQLIVSLNTLRTHTKNIFNKLGVNNRRAAVRRAEELDLF